MLLLVGLIMVFAFCVYVPVDLRWAWFVAGWLLVFSVLLGLTFGWWLFVILFDVVSVLGFGICLLIVAFVVAELVLECVCFVGLQ